MQASEQVTRRRSTRRHIPNINRQEAMTLGEAAELRAQLARGMCGLASSDLVLINTQMTVDPHPLHPDPYIQYVFHLILKYQIHLLPTHNTPYRSQEAAGT